LARRVAVLREHHELLDHIRAQDADKAAAVITRHVEGSGKHLVGQMLASHSAGSERARRRLDVTAP
jgi:DNA-binding GntR family transcriptional regulator